MDQLLKSTPAQLDCTDMRVRPFIQESRPIVKLKLLSQPPGSKLVGLWRRLAPHGHKFPHTGVEGGEVLVRNGEGVGVVWRRRGGGSVSSAQSVEGGPALWLPGPLRRTGVL